MLYQTIAELLESTANMTVIRNNSRQDDGTDTLTGVDWFKFRGNVASNIYVSGNGWLNFGRNAEGGLKVNRRDQASWYVWREEGSIRKEENRFLRIRWRGYSQYNTTAVANLLEFDVVLCDTGDIILKIHTWPTANANGVNQLEASSNVVYHPSTSATEFSFIHEDEDGNTFSLVDGIEEIYTPSFYVSFHPESGSGTMKKQTIALGVETPLRKNAFSKQNYDFMGWDTTDRAAVVVYNDEEAVEDLAGDGETVNLYAVWRKTFAWLIQDGSGNTYTVDKDELGIQTRRKLTGISALTARVFYENGFQFPPASEMLIDLSRPKICKWHVRESLKIMAGVNGIPIVPLPQLIVFKLIHVKAAVQSITINGDETTKWNVSFDGGESWYQHNGNLWVLVTSDGDGCIKSALESLTAQDWDSMVTNTMQFRCWMMAGGWVKQIRIDY